MSIDFTGVTAITIPEGKVSKITRKSDGVVLWEQSVGVESPYSVCPSSFTNKSFISVTNESNGFAFADNTTYASLVPNSSGYNSLGYFNFDLSKIPSDATITGVTFEAKIQASVSNLIQVSLMLTANNTNYTIATKFLPSTSASTRSASFTGTSNIVKDILTDPKLTIQATGSQSDLKLYFYGATLTVEFTT